MSIQSYDTVAGVYLDSDVLADGDGLRYVASTNTFQPKKIAQSESNLGTAATGLTAVEDGDGNHHLTTLTVSTTLPAIAGGAALAVGKLVYTFPAGVIVVNSSHVDVAIQQTEANITADTPDAGLGTTIGSGVVATLNLVGAAAENILTGQTAADCDGTATVKTVGTQLVIEAADDHTVYFNVADTWAASGDLAAVLSGTIVLDWCNMT